MDLCQLDKIYYLLKNDKTDSIDSKFEKDAVECVKRLRFENNKNNNLGTLKNKVLRLQETRPNQKNFADAVKQKYQFKCPISGHTNFFQACHLLPFSLCKYAEEQNSEYNGILLSNTLHDAFDKNYFTFDENTCCVKILNPSHGLTNMGLVDNLYIKELDNQESKYFLKMRNLKIEN